jgi:hypothetical protein
MSFANNIPDPHLGLYSGSVLGRNGFEVNYNASNDWYENSWFAGYYLNNTGASGVESDGYLNNFSNNYTYTAAFDVSFDYQGWVYNTLFGWCYIVITPLTFDITEKKLWVWINNLGEWLYFNRYECYKNYMLGTDSVKISDTSHQDYDSWVHSALSDTSETVTVNSTSTTYTLTAGEGIYVFNGSDNNNRNLLKIGVDSSSNKKFFLYRRSSSGYDVDNFS